MCWPCADQISLLCRHNDYKVASPALRAVGNIVTGDDIQTQVRRELFVDKSLPYQGFGPVGGGMVPETKHGLE